MPRVHGGCGAFTTTGEWFQLRWPESRSGVHITINELAPVVISIVTWGKKWKGKTVRCRCDNAAVVAIINSGKSKMKAAMHLMRALFFFTAKYVRHHRGVYNHIRYVQVPN